MGGMSAMANGGNVIQGMINGGITGAISGAMFYSVPAIGAEMGIGAESSLMAALHVVGGAVSGTVNAVMTGGDIGQGALIGALSAGAAKYFGGKCDLQMPGRMMIGAAAGGLAAAWSGGDVAQGAFWGAWTSAIADICNRQGHDDDWPENGRMFPGFCEDETAELLDSLVEIAKENLVCMADCIVFDVIVPNEEARAVSFAIKKAEVAASERAWILVTAAAEAGGKMVRTYSKWSTAYATLKCYVKCE